MEEGQVVHVKKGTVEEQLIKWCLEYVYVQCVDDNGFLDLVCEMGNFTEMELMNGFENVSQDMGFELGEKVDGMWVNPDKK